MSNLLSGAGGTLKRQKSSLGETGTGGGGAVSDSELKGQGTNPYNGLHALNNLDIAVNGQEVNSMPSYQEVKRRSVGKQQQQKGATESSPESYSPPPPKRLLNNISAASSAGVWTPSIFFPFVYLLVENQRNSLQYIMNTKLWEQRFWNCNLKGLVKTIPTIPHYHKCNLQFVFHLPQLKATPGLY